MLAAFIVVHRDEIIARSRARVDARRSGSTPAPALDDTTGLGIPVFLDQMVIALCGATATDAVDHEQIAKSSGAHGRDLFRQGVTIAQCVREYGDVCQTVTAMAVERRVEISSEEFSVFNLCLDDAIAEAVTAYARQNADEGTERFGELAHELRNLVGNAMMSFDLIKAETGDASKTGKIHARSLVGLRNLIERAIAEVRLDGGIARLERMRVQEFVSDIEFGASLQAQARGITFVVHEVLDAGIAITGDRRILASALTNLLQNAIKFTPKGGTVEMTVTGTVDRVLFAVADQCGGLPPGDPRNLFKPFEQAGADRSGFGLGLTICLKAAKANNGLVHIRDVPGHGCVFTLDLPRTAPPSGLYAFTLPSRLPPPEEPFK